MQQPRTADAVDGDQANGTHSADSKKGILQQSIHLEQVTKGHQQCLQNK